MMDGDLHINRDPHGGRGWVEIIPGDVAGTFWVHDWSEHHDSGALIAICASREEALPIALAWAGEHGCKLGAGVA